MDKEQTGHKKKKASKLGFLKTIDIFAKPVQLTFKGKEKFSSKFGGFLSIAVIVLIISLFAYNIKDLVNRRQT